MTFRNLFRKAATLGIAVSLMFALTACESTRGSYASNYRAFGEAVRPYSQVNHAQTSQAINRFESQGKLLDLLGGLR